MPTDSFHFLSAKTKQYVIVEFLMIENIDPKVIYKRLKDVFLEECVKFSTINYWITKLENKINLKEKKINEITKNTEISLDAKNLNTLNLTYCKQQKTLTDAEHTISKKKIYTELIHAQVI